MADKVKTRIVLKNDTIENWKNENSIDLMKGELAFAKMNNGKYELRIGQDGKYEAGAQLQLSASQIVGLETKLDSVTVSNYAGETTIDPQTATAEQILTEANRISGKTAKDYKVGDSLVLREKIGETGKFQHAAYVWNGTAWEAMDGTYNADSVYFKDNYVFVGDYDCVGNIKKNDSYSTAGKSVQEVMMKVFTKELQSTATKPTFSFTATGNSGEIGTKYTVPAATLKMTSVGSYTYAPTNANCSVEVGNATVRCTTAKYASLSATNSAAMTMNSTVATSAGTANAETYLSTAATYNYKAEATYTDGVMPKTNLGVDQPGTQIKSEKVTKTATATFTGQWPCYYAFTTTDKAAPTALTANNGNVTVDGVTYTRLLDDFAHTTFTADKQWYQLYYLVPTAKQTKTTWSGVDKNNVTLPTKASTLATVTFMDGTTAEYRVFIVSNAQPYAATTCTMTYAS